MGAFTIEQKTYYIKAEKKGQPKPAVNVYCNAFPDDGWKIFKRNSKETDSAIIARRRGMEREDSWSAGVMR